MLQFIPMHRVAASFLLTWATVDLTRLSSCNANSLLTLGTYRLKTDTTPKTKPCRALSFIYAA